MGIDHNKLTIRYRGLDEKLTGVVPAFVVHKLIKA
jgi:hypothetical protein